MTPIEVIAQALYDDNAGGTTDPILQDMVKATCKNDAGIAVRALEEAGYRIVTDPPERPDWSEDKYGIELWFQNYKEWLERNGCPDAGRAD